MYQIRQEPKSGIERSNFFLHSFRQRATVYRNGIGVKCATILSTDVLGFQLFQY